MTDDRHDDAALRGRLRTADPALSLPPADPGRVARLLEETMDTESRPGNGPGAPAPEVPPTRETGTRGRSPLTWLVAAAAVLLIVGAAAFGLMGREHATTPDHAPVAGGGAGDASSTTELSAPAPAAYHARCMVPTAAALGQQDLAFDGTVRSIGDGVVTLAPTHFYAGDSTDLVEVKAPQGDLDPLLTAVRFQQGKRYLVSARDGTVSICGFSAPWSAGLAALYTRAFGGQ